MRFAAVSGGTVGAIQAIDYHFDNCRELSSSAVHLFGEESGLWIILWKLRQGLELGQFEHIW
jgi:hypothetical protein